MTMRWTPERLDQLENAVRNGRRVALSRRGTEYIVVAVRMTSSSNRDAFVGRVPMTGEEMTFILDDLESLLVLP
jgi:hypothetical protein